MLKVELVLVVVVVFVVVVCRFEVRPTYHLWD